VSTELIPYFQKGLDDPLIFRAANMNRIVTLCNAVKRMSLVEGDENKVIVTDDIIVIQIKKNDLNTGGGGTTTGGSKRYRIKSYQQDYYTCRTWDGTTEGSTDVLVAKPKALRGSIASDHILASDGFSTIDISYTYSGNYLTRTASKTGGTFASGIDQEAHVIVPGFYAGLSGNFDEIWASTVDSTGVTAAPTIMDDNRDARVWTSVPLDPAP
jgi:hypothetical protein